MPSGPLPSFRSDNGLGCNALRAQLPRRWASKAIKLPKDVRLSLAIVQLAAPEPFSKAVPLGAKMDGRKTVS